MAYLPSSISGGARNADDVIAQVIVSVRNTAAPSCALAIKGSANERDTAQQRDRGNPVAKPAYQTRHLVRGNPHGEVHDGEDSWTSIRDEITVLAAIPTEAASFGR